MILTLMFLSLSLSSPLSKNQCKYYNKTKQNKVAKGSPGASLPLRGCLVPAPSTTAPQPPAQPGPAHPSAASALALCLDPSGLPAPLPPASPPARPPHHANRPPRRALSN